MPLLPIRSRVLLFMSTVQQANIDDAMDALKSEYGGERQFTRANFLDHMLSLQANGLIDEVHYELDANGELCMYYAINNEGIHTINKYLPKKWTQNEEQSHTTRP
ncbi:hypothetical protein [Paenibacillus dendritiformis]|uniref:Uncharacterized protein n=2 Tax=Paenibacillus dendritiformis TaxID=130049 RepID=H3SIP7_9BACL|nr:hypothetical protein [Paenibacillus dendritiformis]EHQ61001.1 hypothetical protein PDENDC454_17103 [Paenibacillus dendritiformis C454]TDL49665.1 hypothetical protein E2R60_23280 [Paenibacillus dendritiformis]CAH8770878.1 hypothetical protein H7S4_003613 [Paenibacillus dendritiformis]